MSRMLGRRGFLRPCSMPGIKVISPTKAKAPTPAGKGRRRSFTDDEDIEDGVGNVIAGGSTADIPEEIDSAGVPPLGPDSSTCRANSSDMTSRPETADAAGAVAAAEIFQLESLVTMGDGKHDAYTCHCWGLEGTLWAVNEPGQLVSVERYLC